MLNLDLQYSPESYEGIIDKAGGGISTGYLYACVYLLRNMLLACLGWVVDSRMFFEAVSLSFSFHL